MDRVNSNESLVDLWGGGDDDERPNKQVSDCTAATYDGSEESQSPHQIARKEYGGAFTRRSLIDRARVFDKNFHDSFDEKMFQTLTDETQTEAEIRMQEKDMYKFGNMSMPLPGAHHFVSPTLSKEQRESFEAKAKKNKKDETSKVKRLSGGKKAGGVPPLPPKYKNVGKKMKELLDASEHRRSKKVSDGKKGGGKAGTGAASISKQPANWKLKPVTSDPPKPPPELQFKNVVAPPLKINPKTFKPPVHPKTEFQRKLILKAIKGSYVLKDNTEDTSSKLINSMEQVNVSRNEIVLNEGTIDAKDDSYYVVGDGKVEFQVNGVTVDTALPGTSFGQDRLLLRGKNKATIKASCKSTLFKLDQQTFRGIMQQQQEIFQQDRNKSLRNQSNLSEDDEDNYYGRATEEKKTTDFGSRTSYGSSGSSTKKAGGSKKESPKPQQKKKKQSMQFTFEDSDIYQKQKKIRASVKKHAPRKDDLEFISILGEGQFGEVWLVAATLPDITPKRQEFAYKIQQKYDDIREDATDVIKREINVLRDINHPFIVNMVNHYETPDSLDMLLGLIHGEELWDIIHKEQDDGEWVSGIPELQAKFYAFILTDIFAFLESKSILYRDMKPENVMVDNDGYPILVDFGFGKHVKKGQMTFTFCGTPNYVAPEIIKSVGHGPGVDHWALGVVIYEMISGENPFFYDEMDQTELFRAISEDEAYAMPQGKEGSDDALDLIDRLLIKDPNRRLGVNGVQEISSHHWFDGMPNLNLLRSKKLSYADFMAGKYEADEASLDLMDEEEFVESLHDDDDDLNDAPTPSQSGFDARKRGSWIGEDVGHHLKDGEKWAKPLDNEGEEEMDVYVTVRNGKKTVVTVKKGERPPSDNSEARPRQRRSSLGPTRAKAEQPKRNYSSDDADLLSVGESDTHDDGGAQYKKVNPFNGSESSTKGSLKGYYTVTKSPEQRRSSKDRRLQIGGFLDKLGLDSDHNS